MGEGSPPTVECTERLALLRHALEVAGTAYAAFDGEVEVVVDGTAVVLDEFVAAALAEAFPVLPP